MRMRIGFFTKMLNEASTFHIKYQTSPSTSRAEFHHRKVLICIWWNFRGISDWKLLSRKRVLIVKVHCAQRKHIEEAFKEKPLILDKQRLGNVILYYGIAELHTAAFTQKKIAVLVPQNPLLSRHCPFGFSLLLILGQSFKRKETYIYNFHKFTGNPT